MSPEGTNVVELAERLADVARAKGIDVIEGGGVRLFMGKAPTRLEAMRGDPAANAETIAVEERKARIEAAREDMRDQLAANGRTYSDGEIDQMLDPRVLA